MRFLRSFVILSIGSMLTGCTDVIPTVTSLTSNSLSTKIKSNKPVNLVNQTTYEIKGQCRADSLEVTIKVLDQSGTEISATAACMDRVFSAVLDLSALQEGNLNLSATSEFAEGDTLVVLKDTVAPFFSGSSMSDGVFFKSLTTTPNFLFVAASDASGSGVAYYELALGTTSPGTQDVLNWTSVGNGTSVMYSGLSLTEGTTYYPQIRAVDHAGNVSSPLFGDGWIPDVTAPGSIAELSDMNFGSATETPLVEWSATTDSLSGVAGYEIAIGSLPGLTDIQGWTLVGVSEKAKLTGLSLNNGQIYYPSIRALDQAGNVSAVQYSDGFRAVADWAPIAPMTQDRVYSRVSSLAYQSDDKLLVGGMLDRMNAMVTKGLLVVDQLGDPDLSFVGKFDGVINAAKQQADGKIVVAGNFARFGNTPVAKLARLNLDGTLDLSFNVGSGVGAGFINDLLILPDQRIVIAGSFSSYNSDPIEDLAIINPDGSRDVSFNMSSGFDQPIQHVRRLSDGSLIVAGSFNKLGSTIVNNVVKLSSSGVFDSFFDSNLGYGFSAGASGVIINDLEVLSGDHLVVVGNFDSFNSAPVGRVVELYPTGMRKTGYLGAGFDDAISSVFVTGSGDYYFSGTFNSYNGGGVSPIVKINSWGLLDTSFNALTADSFIRDIYVESADNSVYTVGFSVRRFNSLGANHFSFNGGSNLFGGSTRGILKLNDGRFLVYGGFNGYQGDVLKNVARLDLGLKFDGTLNVGSGFNGPLEKVYISADSKIYYSGSFTRFNNDSTGSQMIRTDLNGQRDLSYQAVLVDGYAFDIAEAPDQSLFVGGNFTETNGGTKNRLVKFQPNGLIDATFDVGNGFDNMVTALALDSSGKLLVAGTFTQYDSVAVQRLVRLNSDGTLDHTFNVGSGFNAPINDIQIQANGQILVGGGFTTVNGSSRNHIARLNSDGSLDPNFNVGDGFSSAVTKITLQSDQKILVGGVFETYDLQTAKKITRLNQDGSLDTSFVMSDPPSGYVADIAVRSDGRITIGGNFLDYEALKALGSVTTLGW